MTMKSRFAAITVAATVLLGTALATPALAGDPAFDRWWNYDRPAQYAVAAEYGLQVPTRDGSSLFCNQFRPDAPGTFPGIMYSFRPYAEAVGQAAQRSPDPVETYYAGRGFVVLHCDVPNSGASPASGGRVAETFTPFTDEEARAHYDAIEWLGTRPYSSGPVGLVGQSYGAMTQYRVAALRPPHLRAMIPEDAFNKWYGDWNYFGGIPMGVDAYAVASGAGTFGKALPQTAENLAHPLYDDYWAEKDIDNKLAQIDVPILAVGGWNDYFPDPMIRNYQGTKDHSFLVMGPWGHEHAYPDGIGLAFLDHHLRDDRSAPLPPATVISHEGPTTDDAPGGAGTGWQQMSDFPPSDVSAQRMHLRSGRTLADTPGPAGTSTYVVNPLDSPFLSPGAGRGLDDSVRSTLNLLQYPVSIANVDIDGPEAGLTGGKYFPDQRLADQARLTYTSEPVGRDTVLAGRTTVNLRAASSAGDTNLVARLEDVGPDGSVSIIERGWLRASHRDGHDHTVEVRPGEFHDYTIDVWATHWRVAEGHRIRVAISSGDFPKILPTAPPGTVTVDEGASTVDLPVRSGE